METICFSKDTGKTTSPTGHWEVQTFAHHKDWLISPLFWLALWFVVKYEAPRWKVGPLCADLQAVCASCASGVALHCIILTLLRPDC